MAEASIIAVLNQLVLRAITMRASDIHIETQPQAVRIRYRIDGLLHDQPAIEKSSANQLLSRIKVLASLDIAQSRLPQDGKFTIPYDGRLIDIRVSTFPSVLGEKCVLRILDRAAGLIDFSHLGMEQTLEEQIRTCVKAHAGFFLITGPTGSGKTTTLYALLNEINTPSLHIVTLEDPVEYTVTGITQSQVNPGIGFTFAQGIRAMLRQDPDVILIGEVRDRETASVAIESALTGHLVLSTIHTVNAVQVIIRLMDMGIEPFLINASLTGILAQRLARRICTHCVVSYEPTAQERALLHALGAPSNSTVSKGKGCVHCLHTGYHGRVGIFELLIITDALRELISGHAHAPALEAQCKKNGMRTLAHDALDKLSKGVTTVEEIARVLL
ncbi:MAG: GspE/PulE family protein [Candidatus Babeliales bacterium]